MILRMSHVPQFARHMSNHAVRSDSRSHILVRPRSQQQHTASAPLLADHTRRHTLGRSPSAIIMATNATAKSRDPRIGQDSADLTLGALFLVDNRPKRTRGTSPRNFSNWVIAEHLKRHSYYRHEKEERKLITAGKMRSRIAEIWKKNATAEIKFSDDKREDIVDVLFGMTAAPNKKGSALLKKEYLKKLGYDKETFVESLLNKHDSEEAAVSVEVGGDGSDDEGGKAEAEVDKTEEDHDHSESDEASVDEPSQPQSTLRSRAGQSSTPLRTSSGDQAALKLTLRSKARNFRSKSASADEHGPRAIDEMSQLTSGVYSQTTALATQDAISGASDSTSTEDTLSRDDATTPAAKRKHDAIESSHEVHSGDEQAVFLPEPESKRRRTEEDIVEVRASDEPQSSNVGTPDAEKQKDQTDPESIVETPVKPHGNGGPDTQQKKQREPPLAELNFDEQGRNLEELSRGCKEAINTLLTSIGQIRDEQSPLHPDATGPLEALYARCWGPDWRDVRARLRGKYVFIIPQVTTSLLAAFLYDNVLSQEASPQEIRENFLRLRGTTSKAMLSMFDGRLRCISRIPSKQR
jgi:hypothetical protein